MKSHLLGQLLTGDAQVDIEAVDRLLQEHQLSPVQHALLVAQYWGSHGAPDRGQTILTSALASSKGEDREVLLEALVRLLTDQQRFAEAEALLRSEGALQPQFLALMQGLIALRSEGRGRALDHLRTVHQEFPKDRLLLENLLNILFAEIQEHQREGTSLSVGAHRTLVEEARRYADELIEILPAPEMRIKRSLLREVLEGAEAAIRELEDVERDGYRTRSLLLKHSRLLLDVNRAREAGELLGQALADYPDDFELSFLCGTAFATADENDEALAILEPLLSHPNADWRLFVNVGQIYLAEASKTPERASLAFDLFKRAFEASPSEQSLPGRLVAAGIASGREREAWEIVGRLDLRDNPYFRPISQEEALPLVRELNERARLFGSLYQAGVVPFQTMMQQNARSAWFLWLARTTAFRRTWEAGDIPKDAILVSLPSVADTTAGPAHTHDGILLDPTAILTLGTFDIARELLEALTKTGTRIYLFPGGMEWLDEEVRRLRFEQLPAYRGRFEKVQGLLKSERQRVEIRQGLAAGKYQLSGSVREVIGPVAYDLEHASESGSVYLDDYVDREIVSRTGTVRLTSSPEFLNALRSEGLISPAEAERVKQLHPRPFAGDTPQSALTLGSVSIVAMSAPTLLAWHDAGLLTRWLQGGEGWPKILVGPWAWGRLCQDAAESSLYKEALERADTVRSVFRDFTKHGSVVELTRPTDLQVDLGELQGPWTPGLELLQSAHASGLTLWSDDLFLHLVTDRRGLLPDDPGFRNYEAQVRKAYRLVRVQTTEDMLEYLSELRHVSPERCGELASILFQNGYRVMKLRSAMRVWMKHFVYDDSHRALPYRRLLRDLEHTSHWLPQEMGANRRHVFAVSTVVTIGSALIASTWDADTDTADSSRAQLSEAIVREVDKVIFS